MDQYVGLDVSGHSPEHSPSVSCELQPSSGSRIRGRHLKGTHKGGHDAGHVEWKGQADRGGMAGPDHEAGEVGPERRRFLPRGTVAQLELPEVAAAPEPLAFPGTSGADVCA